MNPTIVKPLRAFRPAQQSPTKRHRRSLWLTACVLFAFGPWVQAGSDDGNQAATGANADPWSKEGGPLLLQEQNRPRERQQAPAYPPPGMGPGPMSPSAMGNFMQQMMGGSRPGGMPPQAGPPMGRPGPGRGPAMGMPGGAGGPGLMGMPRGQRPSGFGGGSPTSTLDMVWSLDLSEEQRQEMMDLSEQLRREKWDLLGKVMDHNADIRRLKAEEVRHRKAIAELGKKIEAVTDAADERASDLLTEDQREQLEEIQQQMSGRSGRRPGY